MSDDINLNHWIYDCETYPNIFSICIIRADGSNCRIWEVSDRKNDTEAILICLRWMIENNQTMVGFNNVGFDYRLIHEIIDQAIEAKRKRIEYKICFKNIYRFAQDLFKKQNDDQPSYGIKEEEVRIRQLDLFLVHHFDNKARMTSLKMLEFNMKSMNISDLPYELGTNLNDEQKDGLLIYNKKDVDETLAFYKHSLGSINFREELTERFGFDCTNMNDSKIGGQYFINRLEKAQKGLCYDYSRGFRQVNKTHRSSIDLSECILPYVNFKVEEFSAVLDWLKKQTIKETKGVFSNIEEHLLGDVAKYCKMSNKRLLLKNKLDLDSKGKPKAVFDLDEESHVKELNELKKQWLDEHPLGYFEETKTTKTMNKWKVVAFYNVAPNLMVDYKGFGFVFGTGGIHGCVVPQVMYSTDDRVIIDLDVKSYYPNLSIKNRIYPEHLTDIFCDIYEDLYIERGTHAKGSAMNEAIKLALNGTYGNSNSQYSPFYDPKFTMTVTINGQLSLCMLVEQLDEKMRDMTMIQANTDGVTIIIDRNQMDEMFTIVKDWERTTKLEMEHVEYSKMIVRDVNNYIAIGVDGSIKRKGAYEYDRLGWHQNHSALVIKKATERHLVYGEDYVEYIKNHKDEFDFMLRVRVPRNSKLVLVKEDVYGDVESEEELQNICRYYPNKNGGKLVKLMPALAGKESEGWRRLGIDTAWDVEPCNDMSQFCWSKLNYDYYIKEAEKLIDILQEIENNS